MQSIIPRWKSDYSRKTVWVLLAFILTLGCREETPETPEIAPPSTSSNPSTMPSGPDSPNSPYQFQQYADFEGTRLGVLHGSNVMGELDDCGCNTNPLGGLARKVRWFEDSASWWSGRILIDGGDLFSEKSALTPKEQSVAISRGETYVEAYNQAGYDAIGLGDRDLALGIKALKTLEKKAGFTFLSANLLDGATGDSLFTGRKIIERAGIRIGLFSVMPIRYPGAEAHVASLGIRIADPVEAAHKEVKSLQAEGVQIILAIAHLSDEEQEILADRVPGITAIFGGQSIVEPSHPNRMNQTFLVGGHEKGKHLSAFTFFVHKGEKRPVFSDPLAREEGKKKIAKLQKRVESRQTAIEQAQSSGSTTNLDWLMKDLVKARTELQLVQMEQDENEESKTKTQSFIAFDLIPLSTSLPNDDTIFARTETLKETHPSLRKSREEPKPLGVSTDQKDL